MALLHATCKNAKGEPFACIINHEKESATTVYKSCFNFFSIWGFVLNPFKKHKVVNVNYL